MDYSKLKVAELKEELGKRSLPVSGKKEELVARLLESEGKSKSTANADLGDLAPPEDDYDWDEPATKTYSSMEIQVTGSTTKSETKAAPAPSSVSAPSAAKPAGAPKQPLEAPKPSSETTAKSPPVAASTEATDEALAAELEKRKRRAERFGIPLADSVKALERAKRFGTTETTLDESKKEARGKRFGNQVWTKNGPSQETKAPAKAKVLDDPVEAEKARKRAERFGGGNEAKKVKT
jgi:SAP domain-containing ribonucleoprotein